MIQIYNRSLTSSNTLRTSFGIHTRGALTTKERSQNEPKLLQEWLEGIRGTMDEDKHGCVLKDI